MNERYINCSEASFIIREAEVKFNIVEQGEYFLWNDETSTFSDVIHNPLNPDQSGMRDFFCEKQT